MKNPNSYGSVYKLSGKRRNPYAVRLTVGWTDEGQQIRKMLGYFPTKKEAMEALTLYHQDPYELGSQELTFAQVYEKWSAEYFPTLANASSIRTITAAYKYCSGLYNLPFKNLRVYHLEQTIDNADVGISTKARIKSLFNLMYKWAMRHEICDKDYASICKPVKQKESEHHEPFTDAELATLETLQAPYADLLIICVYSGWRPSEALELKLEDIDMDALTMRGGLKTEAGINRVVPIHSHIIELVKARYQRSQAIGSPYLFQDEEGKFMTYDKYRGRFAKMMAAAHISDKSPHSTRTTFITLAKKCGVDEYILKRIVGHAIADITEKVYTKRDLDQLRAEIEKIHT